MKTGISGAVGMRSILAVIVAATVAACSPPVPDSGPASREEQRARDAALANPGLPSPYAISEESIAPTPLASAQTSPNADIAAETTAALAATSANSGVPPLEASPSNPPPAILSNPGISSENDFAAVSAEQTIESDAERLAQNRAQYEVIQPTELPSRSASTQPNVVAYALQTSNPKGTRVYNRAGASQSKFQRNCAKYASPDLAQVDFLNAGGPQRDRKGLDPDGDGYACGWDPAPFRAAVGN